MEEHYDIPLDEAVTTRIVNLNAIIPRTTKLKSRNKGPDDQLAKPMIKMDHSNIYKENDILEEGLVEHIYNLNRDERRQMAETGEQLEEIRKQVEVITKLQEVVNSRTPGESAELLANTRITRYGLRDDHNGGKSSQLKIEAERNKFSAKNLFNVRRARTAIGFEVYPPKKFFSPPIIETDPAEEEIVRPTTEHNGRHTTEHNGRHTTEHGVKHSTEHNLRHTTEHNLRHTTEHNLRHSDDHSVVDFETVSVPELKLPRVKSAKGYLKPTSSSMSGMRPVTAGVGYVREVIPGDVLPPRAQTAVIRSRSRRELEILSRVTPGDDEIVMTFENRRRNMDILGERRRRTHLQQLKTQNLELEVKVHNFLRDLDRFNKRQSKNIVKNLEISRVF